MRPSTAAAVVGVALLAAGCASSPVTAGAGSPEPSQALSTTTPTAAAATAVAFPFALDTHCGIDEANIAGRWFEADTPLNDGNANPPKGWDNPEQQGTMQMLSDSTAQFRDAKGHVVRFHVRVGATGPKHLCD